ncbi:hypothetical protein J6P92_08120 [bacterium]|nr:hypothetical protein [bacterium]
MYEFEEFEYEFSKIYKRLLRLELLLKKKIIKCSLSVYGDDVMEKFEKFFDNSKIYNKYKNDSDNRNYFLNIRDSRDIPNAIKFTNIINILTLRHLLHFIFTEENFRVKEIAQKFYVKENINFIELKKAKMPLINLRNYIAHFDFKKYQKDKNEYLQSLLLYEINLGCSLGKYDSIPNDLGYKPVISKIIEKIYELAPELFQKDVPHSVFPYNKDRMIVDMYEDIAVLNGYEYGELKSQWDIIRQKYRFNSKKIAEGVENLESDPQLSLFDETHWS